MWIWSPQTAYASDFNEGIVTESGFRQINLTVGSAVQLDLPVLTTSVKWKSSAPSVASVSSGKVTAHSVGTAVIYAATTNSTEVYESWIITVSETEQSGSLSLSMHTLALQTGDTYTLTASATGTAAGPVVWSSSDPSVVSVSDGKLTAAGNGSAMIYATDSSSQYTASCVVYVLDSTLTLPLSDSKLPLGKTLYNYNKKAITGNVIWSTSDPSVAVVRRGFIEAVGKGTAIITAVTESGDAARCTVTVTDVDSVTAAYMDPNNPVAGTAANLIMIAHPDFTQLAVSIKNSAGTVVQTMTVSTDDFQPTLKTAAGRDVNIWSVPVTFPESDTYTVQCGSGSTYTYSFTSFVSPASENTESQENSRYMTTTALRLREGPDTTYDTLLTIPANTALIISEVITNDTEEKNWGKVTYTVDDIAYEGYVSMNYAAPIEGYLRTWYASSDLLKFLTVYEGFRSTVYYDIVNVPTIGYGQALFYTNEFYNYQTKEEAWAFMCNSINQSYGRKVSSFALKKGIYLTQCQFDALTSFTYNMGQNCWDYYSFKLRTLLIENPNASQIDKTELRYAFGKQSRTGGSFILGLFRRRMNEWQMFTTGNYAEIPVSGLTGELAFPSVEDQNDPEKYLSDWTYVGYQG